jgi:hypothetical protein
LLGGYLIYLGSQAAGSPEIKADVAGNKCLAVLGASIVKSASVGLAGCNGSARQQFAAGSGLVKVGGECMDTFYGGTADGTKVQIYTCNGNASENWRISGAQIMNTKSGKCLDALAGAHLGSQLRIWACNGAPEENWSVTSYSSGSVTGGGGGTPAPSPMPTSTPAAVSSCPDPTPVAPVSVSAVAGCEDFDNGFGAFGPYNGGGAGMVVGAGRVPAQCTVSGGVLTETEAASGATCGGSFKTWTQRYGHWEVKMRANFTSTAAGSAPHPVLILWPVIAHEGEIDFFETNLGQPAGGYLHCVANHAQNCFVIPKNSVDYSQWHVYGIQWTPAGMTGYIDGTKWWSTTLASVAPPVDVMPTIQLDNLSGNTPVRPGQMQVDWVHMYKN